MKATGAWERAHKAGKTNPITGRFFEPRASEEFYDNAEDFDNVHNLIDAPEHQAKIAELNAELRRQQLAYYDSGLIPEGMRINRANKHGMTIYEMVRKPELYPLEKYLDIADLAIARDAANFSTFVSWLSDPDEVVQYWALVGLLLLEHDVSTAQANLKEIFDSSLAAGTPHLPEFAAWGIYRKSDAELGEQLFQQLLEHDPANETLANVFDWLSDDAQPMLSRIAGGKTFTESFMTQVLQREGVEITVIPQKKKVKTKKTKKSA